VLRRRTRILSDESNLEYIGYTLMLIGLLVVSLISLCALVLGVIYLFKNYALYALLIFASGSMLFLAGMLLDKIGAKRRFEDEQKRFNSW